MEKLKSWRWTVVQTFLEEYRDFRGLIDGKPGIIADGFAGFRAIEIANAICSSSSNGQSVRLSAPLEQE